MKTMEFSLRKLRIAQLGLSAIAAMALFLPWGTYLEHMMTDSKFSNVSGFETLFGRCLLTFLAGSLIVSMIESLLRRRATFVHIGFFAVSLLLSVLFYLTPVIPQFNVVETRFGFDLYLVFATLVFAITGMLSPTNNP